MAERVSTFKLFHTRSIRFIVIKYQSLRSLDVSGALTIYPLVTTPKWPKVGPSKWQMTINKLTDKKVQATKLPGNYADGRNLYLRVRDTGAKSFILKVTVGGKQREWTIGAYGTDGDLYTLSKARQRRDEMMSGGRPSPMLT